jgi:hypothetical protein
MISILVVGVKRSNRNCEPALRPAHVAKRLVELGKVPRTDSGLLVALADGLPDVVVPDGDAETSRVVARAGVSLELRERLGGEVNDRDGTGGVAGIPDEERSLGEGELVAAGVLDGDLLAAERGGVEVHRRGAELGKRLARRSVELAVRNAAVDARSLGPVGRERVVVAAERVGQVVVPRKG